MQPSDYIVYVDESGDHGLSSIDPQYPVFVLTFCIFDKTNYSRLAVPKFLELKFKYFGHDMVIFHERDIRKASGAFHIFRGRQARAEFMHDLSQYVSELPFVLIAIVIKKEALVGRYSKPTNPYELAMQYGLERVYSFLLAHGQHQHETHIIFESRGGREDRDLELEFRRVCSGANFSNECFPFKISIVSKQVNSCGLQVADLTARPIGRQCLEEGKGNRAFEVLRSKFYSRNGLVDGWGLKVFPK